MIAVRERNGRSAGGGPGEPLSIPSPDEVRDQLARILASPEFMVPERARSFLRYLVEQTLAGHADRLKGYTIATAVFERDASFDAQADPVVRTEAGRLRRALERYYLVAGPADPVRIEVPKGGYVPDVLPPRRPAPESPAAAARPAAAAASLRSAGFARWRVATVALGRVWRFWRWPSACSTGSRPRNPGHRRGRASGRSHPAGDAIREPERGRGSEAVCGGRDGRDPDPAVPVQGSHGAGRQDGAERPDDRPGASRPPATG